MASLTCKYGFQMKIEFLPVLIPLFIACMFNSLPLLIMANEKHPIYNKDSTVWHCWTDKDQSWDPPQIVLEQTPEENSTAIAAVGCRHIKLADPEWERCDKEYDKRYEKWENDEEFDGPKIQECQTHHCYKIGAPEYTCGGQKEILQCRFTDTNANFKRDDDLGIDRIWTFGDGRTAVMKPDDTVLYYNNSSLPKEIFWHCEVSLSNWREIK